MSKLTLDIPDALHRTIKSVASAQGMTIRDFFIAMTTEQLKLKTKEKVLKKTAEKKPKKTAAKKVKKPQKKNSKYITEAQADRMLKPYLLRMVKRIDRGEEKLVTWEEVKKELKRS
jgi:hypothetical protein